MTVGGRPDPRNPWPERLGRNTMGGLPVSQIWPLGRLPGTTYLLNGE